MATAALPWQTKRLTSSLGPHRIVSFTTETRTGDQAFYSQVLGDIQDPNYSPDLEGEDIIVTFVPSNWLTISKHCKL